MTKIMKSVSKFFKIGRRQSRPVKTVADGKEEQPLQGKSTETSDSSSSPLDSSCEEETTTFLTKEELQTINASIARAKDMEPPNYPVDQDIVKRRMAVVKEIWRRVQDQDIEGVGELLSNDMSMHFTDASKSLEIDVTWEIWLEEMQRIYDSFPDMTYKLGPMRHSCGVIIFTAQASGTHTGAPYGFGPCEPIEAKGTRVLNDPEELCYFFRHGEDKPCRVMICGQGELCGPGGLYAQLGGFPGL